MIPAHPMRPISGEKEKTEKGRGGWGKKKKKEEVASIAIFLH